MKIFIFLFWLTLSHADSTIQEGYYEPKNPSEHCIPGKVFYTKTSDEVILNIGSTIIFSHLDKKKYEEIDSEKCKTTLENEFKKNEIHQTETLVCPKSKKEVIRRTVRFDKNSLFYEISKQKDNFRCDLKLEKRKND